jgi:type II secretory pathway pseudopilin PulG
MNQCVNNTKNKKSFTLPEVLVSIAVIAMVVIAATNLLVASMRAGSVNVNTLVAYGLAQEGIEAVRNIRDSNWLLGANFQGRIGRQNIAPWGAFFPSNSGETRFYIIDRHEANGMDVSAVSQLMNAVPWTLKDLQSNVFSIGDASQTIGQYSNKKGKLGSLFTAVKDFGKSEQTLLYKKVGSNQEVHYTHQSQGAEATLFHRYLIVSPAEYSVGQAAPSYKRALRVACVVEWEEYNVRHSVRLDTELTDWKNN